MWTLYNRSFPVNNWLQWILQLNKHETAPYLIQLSHNLTLDCLLISVFYLFLTVFAWCDHKIVLQIKTKQFYDHIMQKLVKTGKYTEINKQSIVKFWLNWRKYRYVSYSFSCTDLSFWYPLKHKESLLAICIMYIIDSAVFEVMIVGESYSKTVSHKLAKTMLCLLQHLVRHFIASNNNRCQPDHATLTCT